MLNFVSIDRIKSHFNEASRTLNFVEIIHLKLKRNSWPDLNNFYDFFLWSFISQLEIHKNPAWHLNNPTIHRIILWMFFAQISLLSFIFLPRFLHFSNFTDKLFLKLRSAVPFIRKPAVEAFFLFFPTLRQRHVNEWRVDGDGKKRYSAMCNDISRRFSSCDHRSENIFWVSLAGRENRNFLRWRRLVWDVLSYFSFSPSENFYCAT